MKLLNTVRIATASVLTLLMVMNLKSMNESFSRNQLLNQAGVEILSYTNRDKLNGHNKESESPGHRVAGLNCDRYGGPSQDEAAEMVYWEDIPSDAHYVSPLKAAGPKIKYLTFEPDEGGWNNIRMSMETAVTLAHAMGRILVMPPQQSMYLLETGKEAGNRTQKNRFTFSDFFHFDSVESEHAGLQVMSTQEFLEREVMSGKMLDKATGEPAFPPGNRTDWDGTDRMEARELGRWFRTWATNPIWSFNQCVVGLPGKPGPVGPRRLEMAGIEVLKTSLDDRLRKFVNNPSPVDASPEDRLAEMMAHRTGVCPYNETYQNAEVIHMMGDNASGARLLVHFYAFLLFEDWKQDLWTKRFVRDHLRYVDQIQCAAARVVVEMRKKSRSNGHGGVFDTLHIRRGDFQYKETRVDANVIYENIRDVLQENMTVYIATDEREKSFFKVFREHYKVYFIQDFKHVLGDVNTNYYGMIEQRIASRGHTFIGTFYSTFTGYINRMRGYHSQKDKADGWEMGIIQSWYDIPIHTKNLVREYHSISAPMWGREFPVAWRHINKGIENR